MGGPAEPHEPRSESAGHSREDDDTFGFDDPAFEDPDLSRRRAYSEGPGFSPDAGYSPSAGYATDTGYAPAAGYVDTGECEPPVSTEEGLGGPGPEPGGPRRVLPLEDEPTTLVAR